MRLNCNNNNKSQYHNKLKETETMEEIEKHFSINMFNGTLFLLLKWGISHFHFCPGHHSLCSWSSTVHCRVRFYWYNLLWCISLSLYFLQALIYISSISNHVKKNQRWCQNTLTKKPDVQEYRLSPEMVFIYPIVSCQGVVIWRAKRTLSKFSDLQNQNDEGKNKRFGIRGQELMIAISFTNL